MLLICHDGSADSQAAIDHAAEDGAARVTAAGLRADARCESCRHGVADTVLATAADVDASAIVMGTRGRGGVTSVLLGSVCQVVVHHADRAVMVVPSLAIAERRRTHGQQDEAPR